MCSEPPAAPEPPVSALESHGKRCPILRTGTQILPVGQALGKGGPRGRFATIITHRGWQESHWQPTVRKTHRETTLQLWDDTRNFLDGPVA